MTRVVVGLDLSYTATGVAIFRNGVFDAQSSFVIGTSPKEGSQIKRAALIADAILRNVEALQAQGHEPWVFIENYAFGMSHLLAMLGELNGVVKYVLWEHGISYESVPVTVVRKVVVGKGNAQKAQVMHGLLKRHKIDIDEHNLADAAALALTGDYIIRSRESAAETKTWLVDIQTAVAQYQAKYAAKSA